VVLTGFAVNPGAKNGAQRKKAGIAAGHL